MANLSSYLPGGIDPAAVTITGGSINGTTIGASTPSTGAFTTITGSGDLAIDTDTLFVDVSADKVGIGTTSPAYDLDVTGGATDVSMRVGPTGSSGDNDGTLIINNGGTGDAMLRFDYENNTDRARIGVSASGQILEFYTGGDNERMRIDNSGNVAIGTTSASAKLHVDTSGTAIYTTGNIKIANTKGIDFSEHGNASGMSSELLDDYEEGTFTPTFAPTTGSFSSIAYSLQNGYYTKVGDLVSCHIRLDSSSMSVGSAGGYLRIHGFPFTANGSHYASLSVGYSYGYTSVWPAGGAMGGGTTTCYLYAVDAYNNSASVVPSNLGTGQTYLYVSVIYKAA